MSGNVGAGGCEASPGAAMFAGGIDQESEGQPGADTAGTQASRLEGLNQQWAGGSPGLGIKAEVRACSRNREVLPATTNN